MNSEKSCSVVAEQQYSYFTPHSSINCNNYGITTLHTFEWGRRSSFHAASKPREGSVCVCVCVCVCVW